MLGVDKGSLGGGAGVPSRSQPLYWDGVEVRSTLPFCRAVGMGWQFPAQPGFWHMPLVSPGRICAWASVSH